MSCTAKCGLPKKHRLSAQQEPLSLSEAPGPDEFVQIKHTSVGVGIGIGINLGRLIVDVGHWVVDVGHWVVDVGHWVALGQVGQLGK